jgi:hypothetical protein
MYTDKPRPGKGYVLFLLLILVAVFCIYPAGFAFSYLASTSRTTVLVQGLLAGLPLVIIGILVLIGLHAAYHTQYTLRDHQLELKGGGVVLRKVNLEQLVEAKKVPYNNRMLGSKMTGRMINTGVCNRYKNGVLLITRTENIYLSPSDPDKFLELISSLRN